MSDDALEMTDDSNDDIESVCQESFLDTNSKYSNVETVSSSSSVKILFEF